MRGSALSKHHYEVNSAPAPMAAAAAWELPSLTNRDEVTASIVGKMFSVNTGDFEASLKQEPREVASSDCQLGSGKIDDC